MLVQSLMLTVGDLVACPHAVEDFLSRGGGDAPTRFDTGD